MKGISIAMETIVYLILAVTVLSVALYFFLSQAGPSQDQFELEADRNSFCLSYTQQDFKCESISNIDDKILEGIENACEGLHRRFGSPYPTCKTGDTLKCIQECCITCPQR